MSAQVTLTLPDKVYERVKSLARLRQQDIAKTISEHLEATLPISKAPPAVVATREQQYQELDREMAAYIQLHPQLKQSHWGRYVAVYQGQLIDDDADFGTLVERVRSKLPTQIVLMTQVGDEPIRTFVRRSPRFLHNGT